MTLFISFSNVCTRCQAVRKIPQFPTLVAAASAAISGTAYYKYYRKTIAVLKLVGEPVSHVAHAFEDIFSAKKRLKRS